MYFALLFTSLNGIVFIQSLWNDREWIMGDKQLLGLFYSGFLFISFLLIALLSFYFFIRCIHSLFLIIKSVFIPFISNGKQ
jgi:hypothetical protein